jgi:hypothetical protein
MTEPRICASPDCREVLTTSSRRQNYHSPACCLAAKRARETKKRTSPAQTTDRPATKPTDSREAARAIKCSLCKSPPGQPCIDTTGAPLRGVHHVRSVLAGVKPAGKWGHDFPAEETNGKMVVKMAKDLDPATAERLGLGSFHLVLAATARECSAKGCSHRIRKNAECVRRTLPAKTYCMSCAESKGIDFADAERGKPKPNYARRPVKKQTQGGYRQTAV